MAIQTDKTRQDKTSEVESSCNDVNNRQTAGGNVVEGPFSYSYPGALLLVPSDYTHVLTNEE